MQAKSALPFLAVLYFTAFIAGFNENLMNMALMSIMSEYSIDSVTAQWLVTGFMIVATIGVTSMAFFYRRFKLRVLFPVAVGFTLIGSVMGLVAPNFTFLMASRLIQAIGSGIFIPLMMNTILVVTPKNKLGTYMSIGGCTITFGPALAPVVCGALVSTFGWHSVFIVPIAAMVLALIGGIIFVENVENSDAHLDMPSLLISALFLCALSFGLAELTILPIYSMISLVVAIGSGILFVIRQLHCQHPLIDLEPMRHITFWPATILAIIAMMTQFSLSVLLPLYFEGSLGFSAFVAGIIILIPVLCNAGSTLFGGRMMDKHGEWPLLPAGFAVILAGLSLLAFTSSAQNTLLTFLGALIAFVGVGMIFSPSQTAGLRTLPPQMNPFGVAIMTTVVQIAACIGPSTYIGIMSSKQESALATGYSAASGAALGFAQAIMVAAIIAFIGFVIAFAFSLAAKRRTTKQQSLHAHEGDHHLRPALLTSIMETNPYVIKADAPMEEVMQAFINLKIGGLPVIDNQGKGIGYISDGDIMRYLADKHSISGAYSLIELANSQSLDERMRELAQLPVSSVATKGLVAVNAHASLKDACALLAQHKLKKVPVVDHNHIVGTLNRSDVLRYAMEAYLYSTPTTTLTHEALS